MESSVTLNNIRECDLSKPFVFISYSKKDKELVYPLLNELAAKGVNLWFDKELESEGGKKWAESVGKILIEKNCVAVIFMLSENSLSSVAVFKELCYAEKSSTVFEHNNNKPLKLIPVVVNTDVRKDLDSIVDEIQEKYKEIPDEDERKKISDSDIKELKSLFDDIGRNAFEKNYISGIETIKCINQISSAIQREIFTTNSNQTTLIYNEAGVVNQIINNLRKDKSIADPMLGTGETNVSVYEMGLKYWNNKNYQKAYEFLKNAADAGNTDAQYSLADLLSEMYYDRIPFEIEQIDNKDDLWDIAYDYLCKAAEGGNLQASLQMWMVWDEQDPPAELSELKIIADKGLREAQYLYAVKIGNEAEEYGYEENDDAEAYRYYKMSADQGFGPAIEALKEYED